METILFALLTFVPMLLVLVVVHELGHFWTARFYGVKVLEFGVGYPPKVFGLYTGRTTVLLDGHTQLVNANSLSQLARDTLVKVQSTEDLNGKNLLSVPAPVTSPAPLVELVLDSLPSPHSRRAYGRALEEFFA